MRRAYQKEVNKLSDKDYKQGSRDQKSNSYNPPGGGLLYTITRTSDEIAKISEEKAEYDQGWEDSKKNG